jgi:hypothetical protein
MTKKSGKDICLGSKTGTFRNGLTGYRNTVGTQNEIYQLLKSLRWLVGVVIWVLPLINNHTEVAYTSIHQCIIPNSVTADV